ncbi:MAG: hypothetical protein QXP98_03990 [Thermoproteus sp.]
MIIVTKIVSKRFHIPLPVSSYLQKVIEPMEVNENNAHIGLQKRSVPIPGVNNGITVITL